MTRRPPICTRTDTRFPSTTLVRSQDRHAGPRSHLLVALRCRQDFPRRLVVLTRVVRQAQKGAFIILDQRRTFIHVVDDLMKPPQRRVIPHQQQAGVILEQLIREHGSPRVRAGSAFAQGRLYLFENVWKSSTAIPPSSALTLACRSCTPCMRPPPPTS